MIKEDQSFITITPVEESGHNNYRTECKNHDNLAQVKIISSIRKWLDFNFENSDPKISEKEDRNSSKITHFLCSPGYWQRNRLAGYFKFIKVGKTTGSKIILKKMSCICYQRNLGKNICTCCKSPGRTKQQIKSQKLLKSISTFNFSLNGFTRYKRLRKTNRRRSTRLRKKKLQNPFITVVFKKTSYLAKHKNKGSSRYSIRYLSNIE